MLKQRFLIQFLSGFFIKILGIIAGIVVARLAGPEVLGTIAYATAYVGVFGFITGLFGTGHIKLISEGQNLGDCVSIYTRLQGYSISVYVVVVLSWFVIQKYLLQYEFSNENQGTVILIILVGAILTKVNNFHEATFTSKLEQAKANLPNIIRNTLWHVGRIGVVIVGGRAVGLALWQVVAAAVVLPISFKLFKKLPKGKFDKSNLKLYFGITLPIFIIVVINSIIAYSDKLILTRFTDVKELGYYSAAFSLGGMFLLIGNSVGTVFFPLFSSLIAKKDWLAVNDKIQVFEEFITNFIFPIICLFILISEPAILFVLGDEYQASIIPFSILLLATYIAVVGMPYRNILSGMGLFYLNAFIIFLKLIIYIGALIVLLAPSLLNLGAIGIAINLLLVNTFHNLLSIYFAKRKGELTFSVRNIFRYLLIILLAIGLYIFIPYFQEQTSLWWLYYIIIVPIVLYGLLFIFGFIRKKEIEQLLQLINVKKSVNYFKNEIRSK